MPRAMLREMDDGLLYTCGVVRKHTRTCNTHIQCANAGLSTPTCACGQRRAQLFHIHITYDESFIYSHTLFTQQHHEIMQRGHEG